MTSFVTDCILAEKIMNTLPSVERTTIHAGSSAFCKNISLSATLSSPDSRLSLPKPLSCSDAQTSDTDDYCSFITPSQLADSFPSTLNTNERRPRPVLIDCRSQMDFGTERIISSHNVNCRAKLMTKKLMSKRLEDVESNLSQALAHSDSVILYDQSTGGRSEEKIRSSPLNLVVQAAKRSNKKVYILQGGLDAIKSQYPHLIQRAEKLSEEKYDDYAPSTPDAVNKENFTMTEILPHVFVGNILDSQNLDRLNQNGITHIINSTPDLPCCWEKKYEYMRVDVLDLPSQNIRKHFDLVFQFIDQALRNKKNNVLVHCSAGISRSPTLVLAYMIKKHQMKLDEAFNQMRRLRQIVDPNMSFIIQLQDWENKCLAAVGADESAENSLNHSCVNVRPTPSTYCGSTSRSRAESQSRPDSAIVVQ